MKSKLFWIHGKHAVLSALQSDRRHISQLLLTTEALEELKQSGISVPKGISVSHTDAKRIAQNLAKDAIHQGYSALVGSLETIDLKQVIAQTSKKERSVVIALDQVTDPHNIGAIMRSALAFGADGLVITKDNAAIDNATVVKSSSGASEMLNVSTVANLSNAMKQLKDAGYWIIGMDGTATSNISELSGFQKVAIIMGAEGTGLRRLTAENCDLMMKIPISEQMESLNVSTAAAIALYAFGAIK